MEIDRRRFLASVGAGALAVMTPEDKAEALEHYMCDLLDGEDPGHIDDHHHHGPAPRTEDLDPRLLDENDLLAEAAEAEAEFAAEEEPVQEVSAPRGTGNLFRPTDEVVEPLPPNPTLEDFFKLRFWPARHVLQSATHALNDGQPEENILAGLLHDTVQNLIKVDHGWWGAQLYEPYVPEYVSWGIRYHGALRFYPDEQYGYEYPELYNRIFGEDYVPPDYIKQAAEYATNHPLYVSARMICVNDTYAFQDGMEVSLDPFIDIIGRHFKQPKEGLGYDNSPVAHMWRSLEMPWAPL
ncbi:hypothetical protein [Candidatus Palauibacter sp.]|uniref:hypothetical protein n=1 Tax=Candidatus Palauibacter sp. TaxID=3101350 RepID=UPI003B59CC4F